MAWNQGPIQRRIFSREDIWDRVENPARAAWVPEAAWEPRGARAEAEAAEEDKRLFTSQKKAEGKTHAAFLPPEKWNEGRLISG
jgi:hypothetical protein